MTDGVAHPNVTHSSRPLALVVSMFLCGERTDAAYLQGVHLCQKLAHGPRYSVERSEN